MAQQVINLGTGPDTPGGDSRYTAFDKTRANVAELYVVTDAISAFGKTLIDDTNNGAARTTLGLGTAAVAATTDFVASSAVSAFGLTLIDDANNGAARTTLGLGTAATSAATDFVASSAVSAFGLTLIDDANNGVARTTLGLGTAAVAATTDFAPASAASIVPTVSKTGNYTLVLADAGGAFDMVSASPLTLTVPTNASVPFVLGTVVEVTRILTGTVTIAAAGGVTLRTPSSLTLRVQYSAATMRKINTDEWLVGGDLT